MSADRVPRTAVDATVMFLGEDIVEGVHRAGDRLTEASIVARYDVSRSTARAAIQVLVARGLLTAPSGHQPARVTALTDDDAISLYRIRNSVEPALIHRFALRAAPAQIAALDRAMRAFEDTARRMDDLRRIHRARDGFYEVLYDGAGSAALEQTVRAEYARLGAFRRDRLSYAQELARIRVNAASVRRVVPRILQRECSAAGVFSNRMLSEDTAATLRLLDRTDRSAAHV